MYNGLYRSLLMCYYVNCTQLEGKGGEGRGGEGRGRGIPVLVVVLPCQW